MEQSSVDVIATVPPPLPPKMRLLRTNSSSTTSTSINNSSSAVGYQTTVLATGTTASSAATDLYHSPEVHISSNSTSATGTGGHVVKIRINPTVDSHHHHHHQQRHPIKSRAVVDDLCDVAQIRISVNNEPVKNMITNNMSAAVSTGDGSTNYYYYSPYNSVISSGQISPSDTLDSGTCSDLDNSGTPPPLPKKKSVKGGSSTNTKGVSVTVIEHTHDHHTRSESITSSSAVDSDDSESNISCDSLNSGDLPQQLRLDVEEQKSKTPSPTLPAFGGNTISSFLPQGLLQDIRQHSGKLASSDEDERKHPSAEVPTPAKVTPVKAAVVLINESTYEDRKQSVNKVEKSSSFSYDTDCYYNFHLKEHVVEEAEGSLVLGDGTSLAHDDESFAGYKDILGGGDGSSTIRSAKGTVRGVKNRVRAGIATFLQINANVKSYREKDAGKVVVYTTTMGIMRDTHQACTKVKQILRTLLVKFEERDVFMSTDYQAEIRDRMRCEHILVPQVFVDGQHVGDAETVERLNETGELRKILKPYKSMDACTTCKVCGGYRLLPCPVCNGSKKSVHRNHFTAEFVALKCMNCDEVGLIKCGYC